MSVPMAPVCPVLKNQPCVVLARWCSSRREQALRWPPGLCFSYGVTPGPSRSARGDASLRAVVRALSEEPAFEQIG